MTTKTVLAIPYWLWEKLRRHGLSLSTLGDLNKLSQTLCMEDLAAIFALNRQLVDVPPFKENVSSYELFDLWNRWRAAKNKNFEILETMAYSKGVEQELCDRLSVDNQLDDRDPDKGTKYKLIDCEREYCALVVYPGFFESLAAPNFQYGLAKRLLEIFYVYFGAVKCFELPLYGGYIKLLQSLSKA